MKREELNWLLQTIKDADTSERFVPAHYERGRIYFQMMADVAREQGSINRASNRLVTTLVCDSHQYDSSELPIAIHLGTAA